MTGSRVLVGISELEAARAPGTLGALGLGSCVAVILHDGHARIGGLAPVLLPSPSVGRRNHDAPGRTVGEAKLLPDHPNDNRRCLLVPAGAVGQIGTAPALPNRRSARVLPSRMPP